MSDINPGQQRKIRIIEKTFGPDWRDNHPDMAIDAIYNLVIHDDRKSVFFKTEQHRKAKLSEMTEHYDTTLGDFLGMLIDRQYELYLEQKRDIVSGIADNYSGT